MQEQVKAQEFSFRSLFVPFTNVKAIHWIILVGLVVYFNSLFNGFVGDDSFLILLNPDIHSIPNVVTSFSHGNFHDESHQVNNFYRPVLSSVFTLEYLLFGQNPFGYHLISVSLHILNALLAFLVLAVFLKKEFSFFAALLFLIHPINTETVANISAQQELLFLFFGLLTLYLSTIKPEKKFIDFLVPPLLLCSILSKETGAVFLILIPLYNFLYQKEKLRISLLQSGAIFITYLFLRLGVAHLAFGNGLAIVPIQSLPFIERSINIPKIIYYYVITFFYPKDLIALQSWIITKIDFQNFSRPLIIDGIFFLGILTPLALFIKHKSVAFKQYLFFLVWFVISLILHLQILPLDETVSDRWFYLPIIGLLGMVGVIVSVVKPKILIKATLITAVILAILFSVRVMMRSSNWQNEQSLAAHDLLIDKDNFQLERMLGNALYASSDFTGAEAHFIRSTLLFPSQITFSGLGNFYLRSSQPQKAVVAFNKALHYDRTLANNWAFLSVAQYDSGDKKAALVSIKRAYTIAPNNLFLQLLNAIKENKSVQLY